jgi:hypothetical protein
MIVLLWSLACGDVAIDRVAVLAESGHEQPCWEDTTLVRPWRYWHEYANRGDCGEADNDVAFSDAEGRCYHTILCDAAIFKDPWVRSCEEATFGDCCHAEQPTCVELECPETGCF